MKYKKTMVNIKYIMKRNIVTNEFLINLVKNMKIKEDCKNKQKILDQIINCSTLIDKCILAREYLSPQSTDIEKIIKYDLNMDDTINEISGDGRKNGINYEIKFSGHAKKSKLNFVQIRPDHNIDYYIFVCYNMHSNKSLKGKAYILKIPSNDLYDIIINYGGYAHGTYSILGKITKENIKGRNCEYALRCNPNSLEGTKDYKLWRKLLKYKTTYDKINF